MHKGPEDAKPVYANLKDPNDVFEIGMNRAVELLAEKRANPGGRGRTAAKPLKELGEHPEDGGPDQCHGRPLRPLREMGQGQRDPAQRASSLPMSRSTWRWS